MKRTEDTKHFLARAPLTLARSAVSSVVERVAPSLHSVFTSHQNDVSASDIVCRQDRFAPSPYKIPLGVTLDGDLAVLRLFERHTLICGQSGSGKSYLANRILAEVVKIPHDLRYIVGIDLKQSEIGKWNGGNCLDAAAIDFEYAHLLLENVYLEMVRRNNLIWSHPDEYETSKIEPSKTFPLIVVYIDELAVLGLPTDDKEDEEHRKSAYGFFRKLLFLARSAGIIVISCIQRPDAKIIDGFTRQNFQQRIGGRVDSSVDAGVLFDDPVRFPAHKLTGHWFICKFEGLADPLYVKPVGEAGDADLWRLIRSPSSSVPRDRGRWLYDRSHGANARRSSDTTTTKKKTTKKKSK